MLPVARHGRGRVVVLVDRERGADPKSEPGAVDRNVVVITLGMEPLAGRGEHKITIEPIGASRLANGDFDRIRERREVAGSDDILGGRGVGDRGEPSARERGIDRGDIAEGLRGVANRKVDLRARALDPCRSPRVREEHRERPSVARG